MCHLFSTTPLSIVNKFCNFDTMKLVRPFCCILHYEKSSCNTRKVKSYGSRETSHEFRHDASCRYIADCVRTKNNTRIWRDVRYFKEGTVLALSPPNNSSDVAVLHNDANNNITVLRRKRIDSFRHGIVSIRAV